MSATKAPDKAMRILSELCKVHVWKGWDLSQKIPVQTLALTN